MPLAAEGIKGTGENFLVIIVAASGDSARKKPNDVYNYNNYYFFFPPLLLVLVHDVFTCDRLQLLFRIIIIFLGTRTGAKVILLITDTTIFVSTTHRCSSSGSSAVEN